MKAKLGDECKRDNEEINPRLEALGRHLPLQGPSYKQLQGSILHQQFRRQGRATIRKMY